MRVAIPLAALSLLLGATSAADAHTLTIGKARAAAQRELNQTYTNDGPYRSEDAHVFRCYRYSRHVVDCDYRLTTTGTDIFGNDVTHKACGTVRVKFVSRKSKGTSANYIGDTSPDNCPPSG